MRKPLFEVVTSLAVLVFFAGWSGNAPGAVAELQPAEPIAEENAEGDVEAAPAVIAENPGVVLTLAPSNFNLNRSISFDDKGMPQHRNDQLSINFYCFYDTPSKPLAYRDMEITSVITSAGEELSIDPNRHNRRHQQIHANRQRNGKPYFDLYVNLPAPTQHAEEITELRGKLKMELSKGPERVLRLAPVSKYVGKNFRITDMDDSPMSIRWIEAQDNQPAMIEWTYARSIESLVQETKFYRRNGVEFEPNRRGGSGNNNTRSQRFAVGPAEDVIMVVTLFRQTRTVEVPFVARNLPLPIAEPQGPRFDLAVATEPVGGAIELAPGEAAEPAGPGVPGDNDLPIIIIE
ncbi:MAG: hypothetical protein AAGA25_08970 [Planctomycetota bacterium]